MRARKKKRTSAAGCKKEGERQEALVQVSNWRGGEKGDVPGSLIIEKTQHAEKELTSDQIRSRRKSRGNFKGGGKKKVLIKGGFKGGGRGGKRQSFGKGDGRTKKKISHADLGKENGSVDSKGRSERGKGHNEWRKDMIKDRQAGAATLHVFGRGKGGKSRSVVAKRPRGRGKG